MMTCATCGAELQNPYGNFAENALNWFTIHNNPPHKIAGTIEEIEMFKVRYNETHDTRGSRLPQYTKKIKVRSVK